MRKCQTKAIPTDLGTFSHIPAYLKIIMHFQAYSGITQPRQIYAQSYQQKSWKQQKITQIKI